jgi:hypothetical protein
MAVTVTPPATIKVQVGSTAQPRVSAISYGGGAVAFTLKSATDLNMSGAQDRDVITYSAVTDSFVIAPAENSRLIIDNGFF